MNKVDPMIDEIKSMIDKTMPLEVLPPEFRESIYEYVVYRRELTKESDRGCALLAAAHLDNLLEELLRKILIGNKKHFDLVFGITGPLGSFSSRVLLCYSIGLISSDTFHDIQIIRKIRNEFAHAHVIIDFNNSKIKENCNKLKFNVFESKNPRRQFLNVVSSLSGQLTGAIRMSKPFTGEQNQDLEERRKNIIKMLKMAAEILRQNES